MVPIVASVASTDKTSSVDTHGFLSSNLIVHRMIQRIGT
jgi:hypothetical protein